MTLTATTLAADLGINDLVMTLAAPMSSDTHERGFVVQIEAEYILVERRVARTNPQIVRGFLGTERAAHDSGEDVTPVVLVAQTDPPVEPPAETPGGGGGDLTSVLVAGSDTGENLITMPSGSMDGTTDQGAVLLQANDVAGGQGGRIGLFPAANDGAGGEADINGGNGAYGQDGGGVNVHAGEAGAGAGGSTLGLGSGTDAGAGGDAALFGGRGASGRGGDATLTGGNGTGAGRGGHLLLTAGLSGGVPQSGDVVIATREANLGRQGLIIVSVGGVAGLPTSDPGVAGALWSDSLVVKVSAG